jgi:hypothetical protein
MLLMKRAVLVSTRHCLDGAAGVPRRPARTQRMPAMQRDRRRRARAASRPVARESARTARLRPRHHGFGQVSAAGSHARAQIHTTCFRARFSHRKARRRISPGGVPRGPRLRRRRSACLTPRMPKGCTCDSVRGPPAAAKQRIREGRALAAREQRRVPAEIGARRSWARTCAWERIRACREVRRDERVGRQRRAAGGCRRRCGVPEVEAAAVAAADGRVGGERRGVTRGCW